MTFSLPQALRPAPKKGPAAESARAASARRPRQPGLWIPLVTDERGTNAKNH
jgi:hypothetical protein